MTIRDYNSAVDLWADGLYRFAVKNLADAEAARDVVQDSYEKLWVHRDEVNAEKVKSYLFTTAHHLMIDRFRKGQREKVVQSELMPEFSAEQGYFDLHDILHEAVGKLPEIQRSVVLLRDYEGYSYREIGEMAGLSEAQVKVYIYRARIFLKNYIGQIDSVV
jgi:RNA polymerase sigma-70 factor (ECF subfamily)